MRRVVHRIESLVRLSVSKIYLIRSHRNESKDAFADRYLFAVRRLDRIFAPDDIRGPVQEVDTGTLTFERLLDESLYYFHDLESA